MIRRYSLDVVLLAALLLLGSGFLWGGYRGTRFAAFPLDTPEAVLPLRDFNALERFADSNEPYRWTDGSSLIEPPNPGGPLRLDLRLVGGPEGTVPLSIDTGANRYEFLVEPPLRNYHILLPATQGERLSLLLLSPGTVLNGRDLGIMVANINVEGRQVPPLKLVLLLAWATLGGYLLLRAAAWRRGLAVAVVIGFQLVVVLLLAAGGWSYGIAGKILLLIGGAGIAGAVLERFRPPSILPEEPRALFTRRDALVIALLLLLSILVRLPWLAAPDPVGDLEIAARRAWLLTQRGFAGAFMLEGDYLPLRLYLLWGLGALGSHFGVAFDQIDFATTRLMVKPPQVIADIATMTLIYGWSRRWRGIRDAALIAAIYTCAPPIWMNSAWWGQVDALLMLPLLGAVILLDRAGGRWSWASWGIALLIKPQAIILAPLLFVVTLRRHGVRALVPSAAIAAAIFILGCTPFILAGQGYGLVETYLGSIERFPRTNYGAYNLWYLAFGGKVTSDRGLFLNLMTYRQLGMGLLAICVALVCLALWRRSNAFGRAQGAAILALAFFALPTQIHERYLFLSLAFIALCCAIDRRYLIAFFALSITATLNIIGILKGFTPLGSAFLAANPGIPLFLCVINLVVLIILLWRLVWYALAANQQQTPDSSS